MRKLRTREHQIEDLGFNSVERHILKAGFVVQRYGNNDYSYDGLIHTFDNMGASDNVMILFQLKSTDNIKLDKTNKIVKFDLSKRDLELWLMSQLPVLFILYDAQAEISYCIDLQDYFNNNKILLRNVTKFIRVNIPITNILSLDTFRTMYHNRK